MVSKGPGGILGMPPYGLEVAPSWTRPHRRTLSARLAVISPARPTALSAIAPLLRPSSPSPTSAIRPPVAKTAAPSSVAIASQGATASSLEIALPPAARTRRLPMVGPSVCASAISMAWFVAALPANEGARPSLATASSRVVPCIIDRLALSVPPPSVVDVAKRDAPGLLAVCPVRLPIT